MKVKHKLIRAIQSPDPRKVYGAKVESINLQGKVVEIGWAIFGRKLRWKKKRKSIQAKEAK